MKFSWLFISWLIVTGCVSTEDFHGSTLVKIEHKRQYEPVETQDFSVTDKNIKVTYIPDITDSGVAFKFENLTDKTIKIIWDEASFIDTSGASERVFHSEIKFNEKASPQIPTTIPPKVNLTDTLTPLSLVSWTGQYWQHSPLCGIREWSGKLQDDNCIGKTFSFFITYEINGIKKGLKVKYKYVGKTPLHK